MRRSFVASSRRSSSGSITSEAFDWILARVAHAMGIGCDAESAEYLRRVCQQHGGDLRPYLPADVCKLLKALAQYEGIQPILNPTTVDRVLALYYTKGTGGPGGYGKLGSALGAPAPANAAPAVRPAVDPSLGPVSTF